MVTSNLLRVFCQPMLAAALIAVVLATPEQTRAASSEDDDAPPSEYSLAKQALDDGDYDVAIDKLTRLTICPVGLETPGIHRADFRSSTRFLLCPDRQADASRP